MKILTPKLTSNLTHVNPVLKYIAQSQLKTVPLAQRQGCSEGTSSVTFEVLIISCHTEFTNLVIFNCLKVSN